MLLFLLPLMVPPITYGIPLATVLYQVHLAGTIYGRDPRQPDPGGAVRDPGDDAVHRADRPRTSSRRRACSAPSTGRVFRHVLVPLLAPGILAASLLVLVRTIAMFELTFLTAGLRFADAGRRALLRGVRRRRARAAVGRCDGDDLHGRHAGLAADRAALRQSDAARVAGQGTSAGRAVSCRAGLAPRWRRCRRVPPEVRAARTTISPRSASASCISASAPFTVRTRRSIPTRSCRGDPGWGICGVSLKTPRIGAALAPQDGLYSVLRAAARNVVAARHRLGARDCCSSATSVIACSRATRRSARSGWFR